MAATTDLNTQFDTQRATQMAEISAINAGREDRLAAANAREAQRVEAWDKRVTEGRLVPLGDGRFRVNEPGTFDDGEVFTARQVRVGETDMVIPMPEHGLAENNGKVSFYGRVPEWTKVGQIIPEGVSDVDEVLRLGGIDWEVSKLPSYYRVGSRFIRDERSWHNVRNDTNYSLGTVGSVYRPFQNRQAADFLHHVVGDNGIVFETAGELRDGETVFITMRMPENIIVDEGGLNDPIARYLAWSNNHSGKGKAKLVDTPWRIRCGNTHTFALKGATRTYGISHSGDLDAKVAMARKALGMSEAYFAKLAEEETRLARTDVSFGDFDAIVKDIWPEKDEPTKREQGISDRRRDTLRTMFAGYSAEMGQSAYALENTMTDFLDHVAPRRALKNSMAAARATALLEEDDLTVKSSVHRHLLTLTTR